MSLDVDAIEADEERRQKKKELRKAQNARYYEKHKKVLQAKGRINKRAAKKTRPERIRQQEKEYRIKMKSTWEGQARWLAKTARQRSEKKGTIDQFAITSEWILAQFVEQEYKCLMTGRDFELQPSRSYHPWQPSLDRIENDKGYTPKNTRIVCLMFNLARNNATDAEIIEFAGHLVAHHSNSE